MPRKADILTDLLVKTGAGTFSGVLATRHEKSFLDTVNQSVFMPRGLYAMVVEFKEEVSGRQEGPLCQLSQKIDRTLFAAEYVDITEPPMNPKGDLRTSRKDTSSQIELPESRPLIFPDLDCAAAGVTGRKIPNSNEKHEKLKKAGVWIGDQIEKRNSASNVRYLDSAMYPLRCMTLTVKRQIPHPSFTISIPNALPLDIPIQPTRLTMANLYRHLLVGNWGPSRV